MNASLDELRAALHRDADAYQGSLAEPAVAVGRIAGVRRRAAERRRRRAGALAGSLAAVVALAVVAAGPLDLLRRGDAVQPARSAVLPEYFQGGRLIGHLDLPAVVGTSRTVTVVPSSWGLAVHDDCTAAAAATVGIRVKVNGTEVTWGSCGGVTARAGYLQDQQYWTGLGVRLGRPFTITLTVVARDPAIAGDGGVPATPASGPAVASLGVYQDVPVEQYPFPPAPSVAPTPMVLGQGSRLRVGTQVDLAAANGTWTGSVPYSSTLEVEIDGWGPGQVTVTVGGRVVAGASFWDYGAMQSQAKLRPDTLRAAGVAVPATGDPLEVTVTATRFAGHTWAAGFGVPATP